MQNLKNLKNLPNLRIGRKIYLASTPTDGELVNIYKPLKNLIVNDVISDFRTTKLDYNIDTPINIEIQPSFDGSVNLILNSEDTKPKIINTRFSTQNENRFLITDHKGNKDTNLYDNNQLDLDTRLYKTVNKIPKLYFKGLSNNGKMKSGSYHFYFKLSDNDGNETDFITESGLIICHIGEINSPNEIRMGISDEDSKKSINFELYNLDSSFDFVNVYYTKTTSDQSQQDVVTSYVVDSKFPIKSNKSIITISGFEEHTLLNLSDINPLYEIVDNVKAQAQCQNMLFLANVSKPELQYKELADLSLRFTPKLSQLENIGNLDGDYYDWTGKKLYEYYNVNNIYKYLGYWPEEYYRFGIVYLLNDYTLSPVFNVRGLDFDEGNNIKEYAVYNNTARKYIVSDDDGYLQDRNNSFENARGVIKISKSQVICSDGVKPIGINFLLQEDAKELLNTLTKGFFIVRQERIPTIYAQGAIIGKTRDGYGNIPIIKNAYNKYVTESFLNGGVLNNKIIETTQVERKAAIIPESVIRYNLFNQLFNSGEFKLTRAIEQYSDTIQIGDNYILNRSKLDNSNKNYNSLLTLVKQGLNLTTNGRDYFSSKAGNAEQAWDNIDVSLPWNTPTDGNNGSNILNATLSSSESLVRGNFGSYVGLSNPNIEYGTIFNVRSVDFDDGINYKQLMFKLRMNSTEPFFAVSDRIELKDFNDITVYRGDCYVCNFSHRIIQNFEDPELPTNIKIVDKNTWNKNYTVWQDSIGNNRILTTFKTKLNQHTTASDTNYAIGKVLEPSDPNYTSAGSGLLGIFDKSEWITKGCDKINRGDVNAVPLGHWVTFKVLSNTNLSMRDIDFSNPSEEAIHGYKRSFYPLKPMNKFDKLPESNIINGAANVTLSKRFNFIIPDVPFIKNKFDTRILYSDLHINDAFKNGYRVFQSEHYKDYAKNYGGIVDIKEWYGNLFVTLEHGCLLIPVNERAVAAESTRGLAYINTANVLPDNPKVVSDLFGSTWQESIIKTKSGIYGIDTVAKKIWMSDGQTLVNISDLKVQKFLNEKINLNETDKNQITGLKNVKSHYNKTKGDIMFTFYNEDKEWNLCYNENLKKFTTFYTWTPSYSANINNVFFSFDKEDSKRNNLPTNVKFWKHGQSGIYDNQNIILPTNWYGKQHKFDFEFIVTDTPGVQKIFNNLELIANKAEPESFEFEIVGESYDWYEYKEVITWIHEQILKGVSPFNNIENSYKYILRSNYKTLKDTYSDFPELFGKSDSYQIKKLPYIPRIRRNTLSNLIKGKDNYEWNTCNTKLISDNLLNEDKIHIEQLGNNLKKYGRIKGNMQYLEDVWNVEIKPLNFKYAYMKNNDELGFTDNKEAHIRDKYIKIKVKYSGEDLAIIQAVKTMYTISFA